MFSELLSMFEWRKQATYQHVNLCMNTVAFGVDWYSYSCLFFNYRLHVTVWFVKIYCSRQDLKHCWNSSGWTSHNVANHSNSTLGCVWGAFPCYLLLNHLFIDPHGIHWSMSVSHHLTLAAEAERKHGNGACWWCDHMGSLKGTLLVLFSELETRVNHMVFKRFTQSPIKLWLPSDAGLLKL